MPKFNTFVGRMLDVDIPIVQAPMGGQAVPGLVAVVSSAGAFGMLSAG
jgi:NAD(P)H-dependent flavin oxidoreductase YrpB (nitropropane dioxygenase family)